MSEQKLSGQPAQGGSSYGSTYSKDTQGYPQPTYPKKSQHHEPVAPVNARPEAPPPVSTRPEAPPPAAEEEEGPSNFLALSILLTVLSGILTAGLCLPLTLPALLCSVRSIKSRSHGNLKSAQSSGRCALRLNAACMIASTLFFGAGIFSGVISYLVIAGVQASA